MSVKFELDNGEMIEYATWVTDPGHDGYHSDEPHSTKCGLRIKEDPDIYACDHLECAIHAARNGAIWPLVVICAWFLTVVVLGWYETGDPLKAVREMGAYFILPGLILIPMSVIPFKHWLELNEYRNHETINGIRARKLG